MTTNIVWNTRTKGIISTSQGDLSINIKKKHKGSNGYNIYIEDKDTGLFELTINDARNTAKNYTQYWV